ncbi:MAG: squalene synthase HpnC [Planctomycetota bacterium]
MSTRATLRQSERFARRLARSHYENFLVASILLPRRLRQPFYNIYAFCRTADDVADESPDPETALGGLRDLQCRIDDTFAGKTPQDSFFPALAGTIATFRLDKKPFDDLLSAFRQDQHKTLYESDAELIDYCTRSANPVGRLVLALGDSLNENTAPLSDHICTGLQLANFWQDVSRDLKIGRIYLPADRRDKYGVDATMLQGTETPPPVRELLRELCEEADALFDRGLPLADQVPNWLATDIRLFAHGGKETLNAIRKIQYDVLRVRPKVGKMKQVRLVTRALFGLL